ncbi:OpgC domain-containing protein [Shimia marina]|uniref:OpgC protein n=1 Tax=Shimia marina TaxID=321267 RepID=A0A0P1EQP8_9RHOB|nr:OpgC domain-containing protein [Shimia marina]CUH52790.1 OpgC protein [Shimia marina]SFD87850.1 OpgC protein [Shimia marina]
MRFDLLDGVRGHLLFMMMLAHLAAQPGMSYLMDVHHARVFQILDAEFLVVLSGLLVGILYSLKFQDPGRLAQFLRQRIGKIYRYYLISAGPFLILLVLEGAGLGPLAFGLGEVLLIQDGGAYSDILPIYIYCFALLFVLSFALRFVPQGALLLPSGLIYLVSLFNYEGGVFGWGGKFLVFDIAAWQFLFFISYYLGLHFRQILDWLNGVSAGAYLFLVLGTGVLALGQRWAFWYPVIGNLPEGVAENWFRMQLHPVHLLRTLAVAAFFTVALVRAVRGTAWLTAVLRWYFSLPLLRYCGVWAIQMFVAHVYMIALFAALLPTWDAGQSFVWAVLFQGAYMVLPFGIHYVMAWQRRRAAALS